MVLFLNGSFDRAYFSLHFPANYSSSLPFQNKHFEKASQSPILSSLREWIKMENVVLITPIWLTPAFKHFFSLLFSKFPSSVFLVALHLASIIPLAAIRSARRLGRYSLPREFLQLFLKENPCFRRVSAGWRMESSDPESYEKGFMDYEVLASIAHLVSSGSLHSLLPNAPVLTPTLWDVHAG